MAYNNKQFQQKKSLKQIRDETLLKQLQEQALKQMQPEKTFEQILNQTLLENRELRDQKILEQIRRFREYRTFIRTHVFPHVVKYANHPSRISIDDLRES